MDNEKKPIKKNLLEKDLLISPAGTGKPLLIIDDSLMDLDSASQKNDFKKYLNSVRKKGNK